MTTTKQLALQSKAASKSLSSFTAAERNDALQAIANVLLDHKVDILAANQEDVELAKKNDVSREMLDRLTLTEERLQSISQGLVHVKTLPDPLSQSPSRYVRDDGLIIENHRVPFGVIAMVYEARPNVTVDAAGLCLKSGNSVLLRGSSSAQKTNRILVTCMQEGLKNAGLPADAITLVPPHTRENVKELGQLRGIVDVMIPRGGAALIQTVVQNSTVPVLETGEGNCHLFIDQSAREDMAISVAIDAKTDRPSVCNAIETILINEDWLSRHGKELLQALLAKGVTIYGDEDVQRLDDRVKQATEEDWAKEYLDPIVAIKCVSSVAEAAQHIDKYGTKHSEAIISEDDEHVEQFRHLIDAAAVYHNASTRFTDGAEFGFGAEIGISTQKLHARGPLGLEALTTNKYYITGTGQTKGSGTHDAQ
ncbi:glutamate-5-semialdehyde dehydrogenase [Geomicrobium sp. JSM 1781026]|uniref:glutamate-5-semialdehyde dehydrogenase n=1 Tax=Geomicrobium sp. JSM 1781026 TaxID=3344580 RepID=UPI0035C2261E